jgi:glycerophosphoryl diester phosphodiesterase
MAIGLFLALALTACSPSSSNAATDGDTDGDTVNSDGDLDAEADVENEAELESETDAEPEADIEADVEPEAETVAGFPADHPLLVGKLLNVAHRGGGKLAPEESLQAFQNAVNVGADMLEMDLHASSDGVVVLHHDATVDRVTDGTGLVKEMSFEQLRALDAGYRYTNDGGQTYPFRGTGVVIPTFREILEAFPDMIFSAEIKQSDPPIVDAVLEILADTGMEDRVILVSFSDATVRAVREKNPRIVTGAATGEMVEFSLLTEESAANYTPPCPIFQIPGIDAALLGIAQDMGLVVQVWTINDPDDMRLYRDMGVNGIMTDDPAMLETILNETAR